jgi:glutamate/tyrosine decarboxylase-like PLP-dependent enzyme
MPPLNELPLVSVPEAPPSLQGSKTTGLPFPDPQAFDPDLQGLLQGASDLLGDWFATAAHQRPLPGPTMLPPVSPGQRGLSNHALLAEVQQLMEGAYNPNHPGALAHLDPPPLLASVVGDLIAAGLNNNLLAEELSPSLSRLEKALCGWLAEAIGLPPGSGGVPASGGTLSNLMALVVARHKRGLDGVGEAVVLCSADAHVSLAKAMRVIGLPPDALRTIAVDAAGRLDSTGLAEELADLDRRGVPVIAVVATAGTTVRGAVDPLPTIASLCHQHGVWLHVDGAIGAVFALSEGHRHRVAGLELADSVTMNPQKLLGITKTSSLLLLACPAALNATFATGLPYMEPSWGGGHGGEAGLQGTRPAEVLKLWLGLRQLGLEGIAAVLDGAISRRRQLQQLLEGDPRLRVLGGSFHLLAFRPAALDRAGCDLWSQRTRQLLLRDGLMLSRPDYQGYHHLKAVLGNPHTASEHLEALSVILLRSCGEAAGFSG